MSALGFERGMLFQETVECLWINGDDTTAIGSTLRIHSLANAVDDAVCERDGFRRGIACRTRGTPAESAPACFERGSPSSASEPTPSARGSHCRRP